MYLGPLSFLMPTKNVLVGATYNSWRTLALIGNIASPRADGKYNQSSLFGL